MPDVELGERICIYIVARDGADVALDEVRAVLRARELTAYKLPDRVVLTDAIPHIKIGKIARRRYAMTSPVGSQRTLSYARLTRYSRVRSGTPRSRRVSAGSRTRSLAAPAVSRAT
jgi:hypothetical protein